MSTKKKYNDALKELEDAIKTLERARKLFAEASNSLDDFPTARHEIMNNSEECQVVKNSLESFYEKAYEKRIK